MYIITFYSFKGGVGRTMALVNTAAELARRGRKVLLVDFDLEAPGLNTYELLRPKNPHPGIVEYVTEFRRTRRSPLVTDFIYEARPVGKKDGQLWVMPAGRGDAEYRRMLNALNWRTLYQDEEGFLLFEDTRLQWEAELHPDYVLIDARTGHTDIEGICTRQLADAVVVVFFPNEQNLTGLREVCRHIRAEETSGLKKKIKLHFVASNVPDLDDEDRHLRRQLSQFRRKLDLPYADIPIIHRKETLQMLNQPIFVLERPRSRLAREYRCLVRSLQIKNLEDREGALLFFREIQKDGSRLIDRSENDPMWLVKYFGRNVPDQVLDRMNRITEQFWNDAEVLFRAGQYFRRHQEPDKALIRLNRSLALQPDLAEALFERAFCHRLQGDDAAAVEDLLQYLRDYGSQVPALEPKDFPEAGHEMNEKAVLELLSISVDAFLKTLDLPPVQMISPETSSHHGGWLLFGIIHSLIQKRHWQAAIRCLEHLKVKHLIETNPGPDKTVLELKRHHAFCLAIAQWGKAGRPSRKSCLQAIRANQLALDADPEAGVGFQGLSLLYLGAGDPEKAAEALNQALVCLEGRDESRDDNSFVFSYWTFGPASVREYLLHCEQLRRMIRGEPVRPAFVGEPAALREVGGNER